MYIIASDFSSETPEARQDFKTETQYCIVKEVFWLFIKYNM